MALITVNSAPDLPLALIMSVEGLEKEGKTGFCLTAPKPLVILSLDTGTGRALRNYLRMHPKDKGKITLGGPYIYRPAISVGGAPSKADIDRVSNAARPYWKQFKADYDLALSAKHPCRTVVVDTGTALLDLIEYVFYGKTEKIAPILRKILNGQFMALMNTAKDSGKNVIFIHRLREKWIDKIDKATGQSKPINTGEFKPAGWNQMAFEVDTIVRVGRDKDNEFTVKILRSGLNPNVDGEELSGKLCTFTTVASMVFENDPEDWR